MAATGIESLLHSFSAASSRRAVLRTLSGGALAAVVTSLAELTDAKKKKGKGGGKGKKKKEGCKGARPVKCGKSCCAANETCRGGTCVDHCRDGEKNFGETDLDCGGPCRNVRTCTFLQTCAIDGDCFNNICAATTALGFQNVCVECRIDSDCDRLGNPLKFRCFRNICTECAADFDCPRPGQPSTRAHCVNSLCVECAADRDCPAGKFCVAPLAGDCLLDTPCTCRECRTSADCPSGQLCDENNACVGETCAAGRDFCQDGIIGCNGNQNCACRQTITSQPLCGIIGSDVITGCTSDANCVALGAHPSARCVKLGGPCGGTSNQTICTLPCVG